MSQTTGPTIITNAMFLDVEQMRYHPDSHLVIEQGCVQEIDTGPVRGSAGHRIDAGGHVVMPGLIDAHVHAMAVTGDFVRLAQLPPYYVAARAGAVLKNMLMRGFTTVRDAGGAEAGLKRAVAEGLMPGPRLLTCDLALAQTGGQGDFRGAGEAQIGCASCQGRRSITTVADGEDAVRHAARQIIRGGADHIKVMASGGVASGISIDRCQFNLAELCAMVEEAERAGLYVMAHAYQDEAVNHCLAAGIRSIEHASHLSDDTLRAVAKKGAAIVPTLSVYAVQTGPGAANADLFRNMLEASRDTIRRAHALGVTVGLGTDLSGAEHDRQSGELSLRAETCGAEQTILSATRANAAICGLAGRIGTLSPGAFADLLVVEGDPLADITCLTDPDPHLRLIMKDGHVHKTTL